MKTFAALSRYWSLVVPAMILLLAVALQGMDVLRETPVVRGPHLAKMVPFELPGWSAKDLPLGPSEFLATEAQRLLNCDEYLNREYSSGSRTFGVYVAYWGAGKMPTRLVATHTPDRCWTENGWHCQEMKFHETRTFQGMQLQPGEWRRFTPPTGNEQTYVLFWLLVQGKVYDYGDRFNAVPDPLLWWKDVVHQAVAGSQEKYFIRLTSNQPLEEVWDDPGFAEVLRGLSRLGLAKPGFQTAKN